MLNRTSWHILGSGALAATLAGSALATDTDRDGVPDERDNCPNAANPDQHDFDNDGVGDACDACPYAANHFTPLPVVTLVSGELRLLAIATSPAGTTVVDRVFTPSSPIHWQESVTAQSGDPPNQMVAQAGFDLSIGPAGMAIPDVNWVCGVYLSSTPGCTGSASIELTQPVVFDVSHHAAVLSYDTDITGVVQGQLLDLGGKYSYVTPGRYVIGLVGVSSDDLGHLNLFQALDFGGIPEWEEPDNDGVSTCLDNCPITANRDQLDSDGDGVGDACDGCPNDPLKTHAGTCGCAAPETCGCAGDIDADNAIGPADLALLLGAWGACGSPPGDFDNDGCISATDLGALLGAWGPCR